MNNKSKYKEIQYNDYTAEYIIDFRAMVIVESNLKENMQPNLDYIDEYFENIRKNQKIPTLDDIGEMTKLIVNREEGASILNYNNLKKIWIKDLSGKAEGRRQKAEGNSASCPLPVTGGNKGLRPPLNNSSVAPSQEGFESPSDLILLPSALCLLPSSIKTNTIIKESNPLLAKNAYKKHINISSLY